MLKSVFAEGSLSKLSLHWLSEANIFLTHTMDLRDTYFQDPET